MNITCREIFYQQEQLGEFDHHTRQTVHAHAAVETLVQSHVPFMRHAVSSCLASNSAAPPSLMLPGATSSVSYTV